MSYFSLARMRNVTDADESFSHYENSGNINRLSETSSVHENEEEPIYSKPDLSKKISVKRNSENRSQDGRMSHDQDGGASHDQNGDISRDRLPSSPQSPVPPALPPRPDSFNFDDTLQ